MALADRLANKKPRTAADAYSAWLANLPETERVAVVAALADTKTWSHKELKPVLEADEENPAPIFGMTAFREWRAGVIG